MAVRMAVVTGTAVVAVAVLVVVSVAIVVLSGLVFPLRLWMSVAHEAWVIGSG